MKRALQLTSLIGLAALFSGCQHLHLTPSASQTSVAPTTSTEQSASAPTKKPIFNLGSALPWSKSAESLHDYQAKCLAKSSLHQPQLSGSLINTPRYALVTLQREANVLSGGELCIVNKITHSVEITAIDNLEYIPHANVGKNSLAAAQ